MRMMKLANSATAPQQQSTTAIRLSLFRLAEMAHGYSDFPTRYGNYERVKISNLSIDLTMTRGFMQRGLPLTKTISTLFLLTMDLMPLGTADYWKLDSLMVTIALI